MRSPSARCTPNTVTTKKAIHGAKDVAGGRVTAYGPESDPIRCSVQPSDGRDVPVHLREMEVTYLTVLIHDADPGLHARDQVLWNGQVLTVTASLNCSGRGVTFKVLCELRR